MIGSNALSCSCPPSAAKLTVTSLPMTSKATWLTTSGITGLTLPGMMLEPACTGGRLISPNPARGPLDSSRRSLQVFDSFDRDAFEHTRELHEGARILRGFDQIVATVSTGTSEMSAR